MIMTLEDRIALKQAELKGLRSGVEETEKEFEVLENEQEKQENTLSPFLRSIGTTPIKDIDSHTYNLRRNGWNAAMEYILDEYKALILSPRIVPKNWVVETIENAIEK